MFVTYTTYDRHSDKSFVPWNVRSMYILKTRTNFGKLYIFQSSTHAAERYALTVWNVHSEFISRDILMYIY
jgi:hypothetical protein